MPQRVERHRREVRLTKTMDELLVTPIPHVRIVHCLVICRSTFAELCCAAPQTPLVPPSAATCPHLRVRTLLGILGIMCRDVCMSTLDKCRKTASRSNVRVESIFNHLRSSAFSLYDTMAATTMSFNPTEPHRKELKTDLSQFATRRLVEGPYADNLDVGALNVGAGFSGTYMLYQMRT